jgi:hypothetical protein
VTARGTFTDREYEKFDTSALTKAGPLVVRGRQERAGFAVIRDVFDVLLLLISTQPTTLQWKGSTWQLPSEALLLFSAWILDRI